MERTILDEKILFSEQKVLAKTVIHSLVNMIVQQHNSFKQSSLIPPTLARDISSTDLMGIDSLIKDSHRIIQFHGDESSVSMTISFEEIGRILLNLHTSRTQREELLLYLRKGASSFCLHDIFKISKTQTAALRKQYEINITTKGRQDLEDIDSASLRYQETKTDNLKHDLLRISTELNIPLNTVWHAVRNQPQKSNTQGAGRIKHA
ncbi:hypothetical protein DS885_03880 [Psychromonas sp. B3M02]|uniref:hypothetical protein n=1 Tax=Psychromonas sp. B3M02 TaxID=2267226 RepID=UPI000DE965F1|nr:hypothetical protein [Psychromonas sp. B3M02]RBW47296.1 hypothetical protein DS885_03880 [Psychromonas sp. B3M02]